MLFVFESFILHVIGQLDDQRAAAMATAAPRLREALKTSASDWQDMVKESLHLSATMEVAILDLWIRNSEIAERSGQALDPGHFAQLFADEYLGEGSRIDVWPEGALDVATARIDAWQRRRADA